MRQRFPGRLSGLSSFLLSPPMRFFLALAIVLAAFTINSGEQEAVEKCHGTAAQCQRF